MKTNLFTKKALVAVLLAGVTVGANALTPDVIVDLGTIKAGVPKSFNQEVAADGYFFDVFKFVLPTNSGSGYSLQTLDVKTLLVMNFTSVSLMSNKDGIVGNADDKLITNAVFAGGDKTQSLDYHQTLAAGSYYLSVFGLATGIGPSVPEIYGGPYPAAAFNGSISVTAPVPEPESYAMFLAGLGIMGAIIRRRSRRQS